MKTTNYVMGHPQLPKFLRGAFLRKVKHQPKYYGPQMALVLWDGNSRPSSVRFFDLRREGGVAL